MRILNYPTDNPRPDLRAGAVTVGLLREAMRAKIMRVMAGRYHVPNLPEDYRGEALSGRPAETEEIEEPHDPEYDRKYTISPRGRARLPIADCIDLWLLKAPGEPLAHEHSRAEESIELLSQAWGLGIAHSLLIGNATEESPIGVAGMSARKGKRLLTALGRAGLIEAGAAGEGRAYAPTAWLRRGVAPILRAAQVEYHDLPEGAMPFEALDFDAAMLLATPLARPSEEHSGRCRLLARIGERGRRERTGVTVEVDGGEVVACERGLDPDADAEASGIAITWLRALSEQRPSRLSYEGDRRLGRDLVAAIAWALFDEQAYAH